MTKRFLQVLVGVVLGLATLMLIKTGDVQAGCPGDSPCRAYAIAEVNDATNYTAIHGYITYGIPTIRDGGFSLETLWIGGTIANYIELGWQRTSGNNPRLYWGYVDNGGNWHGPYWLGSNTQGHDYQIEHKTSDNKWHVYIDGVEKGSVTLGVSSGTMSAGGEVTDWSTTQHNAMGISTFQNLSYKRNHAGYYSWSGWSYTYTNYSYWLTSLSNNKFQDGGYNP